jgi:hypothetical protein
MDYCLTPENKSYYLDSFRNQNSSSVPRSSVRNIELPSLKIAINDESIHEEVRRNKQRNKNYNSK